MLDKPRADLSNLQVIVPARGSGVGKSRLGEALDAEERPALVIGLLLHTLAVLDEWPRSRLAHVVTGDRTMRAIASRFFVRARYVPEPGPSTPESARAVESTRSVTETAHSGLNRALIDGRSAAVRAGATAVLYLPADLPLLTSQALDRLFEAADAAVAAGSGGPVVVLAPADARVGTNGLLVAPPDVIGPCFGEQSLEAHIRAAAGADASLQLVDDPALGFDLDTPDDLERLEVARLVELQQLGQDALDSLNRNHQRAEVA